MCAVRIRDPHQWRDPNPKHSITIRSLRSSAAVYVQFPKHCKLALKKNYQSHQRTTILRLHVALVPPTRYCYWSCKRNTRLNRHLEKHRTSRSGDGSDGADGRGSSVHFDGMPSMLDFSPLDEPHSDGGSSMTGNGIGDISGRISWNIGASLIAGHCSRILPSWTAPTQARIIRYLRSVLPLHSGPLDKSVVPLRMHAISFEPHHSTPPCKRLPQKALPQVRPPSASLIAIHLRCVSVRST
jgi:hypothetical protein